MEETDGTLEKDLRETLVEVMYLSDQLEKQIALLKRKGINSWLLSLFYWIFLVLFY